MSLFKPERLAQMQKSGATDPPRHSVMIVDDEEGNLRVLRSMLANRFRVLEASDGAEALAALLALDPADAPAVILSDQRMPRMTGVELFEHLRDSMPDTIRIIITGFVDVGAIVDAINRAGIYKFVVKPFDHHDLMLTVDRAIEAFEMRQQIKRHVEELEGKVRARTQELESANTALREANAEIERASRTDPLTGLANRRGYFEARERRDNHGPRSALLLLDIDHFKAVNDGYGHAAGDALLKGFADVLRSQCRDGEFAARWGGEEFLIEAAVGDEHEALMIGERLRAEVEAQTFDLGEGRSLRRTCSIGIACTASATQPISTPQWQHTLAVADAALYMAKRSGRNAAVCLSSEASLTTEQMQQLAEDGRPLVEAGLLRALRRP